MKINNVDFNMDWVKAFKSADSFVSHNHTQYYIDKGVFKKEDAVNFYNKFAGNDNKGLQSTVAKAEISGGGSAGSSKKKG